MTKQVDNQGVFLSYQRQWAADISPVKVYEKSRRIGITYAEAGEDALLASTDGDGGMDVWYIGYNKEMSQEYIKEVAAWAETYGLAAEAIEEDVLEDKSGAITVYKIRFASGWRVTALSSRPSNLRGKQGKVIIDEAAFHDDLEELLKAAMAFLMWGGRVVVISTHNGDTNPFNDLVNDIRAGKKPYSLHRTTLDDAIRQGLYKRICLKKKKKWSAEAEKLWRKEIVASYGDDAGEELFVVPSQGEGAYLSRMLIESCMIPDIPIFRWSCKPGFAQLPEHIRQAETKDWCEEFLAKPLAAMNTKLCTYFGEDFGRSGDLTVVIPLQEQQNLVYRAPFVVELRNVPFRQQEQILFYLVDRLPKFSGGALDARGNGQYLAEVAMQRYGESRIQEVMLSTAWYRENMPRYKAAFEDKTIVLPRDADILQDHRSIRMEKGVAKVPDSERSKDVKGEQRHGDSAIAGALALFASTVSGPPAAIGGKEADPSWYRASRNWQSRELRA